MKICVSGIGGHMGAEVVSLAKSGMRGASVVSGVDPNGSPFADIPCFLSFDELLEAAEENRPEVIVDFSHHTSTEALVSCAVSLNVPLVIATTGQTEEEKAMIHEAAEKIPVFFASNYSVGVALLTELARQAARVFKEADIEIVETHHNRKVDAPSGTALTLAEAMADVREDAFITEGRSGFKKREAGEIGIQSVRRGNIVGIHEVLISTANQTITLKHESHSRALFAEGALAAAEFILDKPAGLYDMKSMI